MKIGDEYLKTFPGSSLEETIKGNIVAFGLNYFYIRGYQGYLVKVKYKLKE